MTTSSAWGSGGVGSGGAGSGGAGSQMAREMAEQPAALRSLIERAGSFEGLPPCRGITVVARGSSDHAAVYGRYLLEAATGKPVSLAAPSLHTLYKINALYEGQLVVAVSQSGQTPEIVETLRALCAGGGHGVAITNDRSSPLAEAAESVFDLGVGDELAVPATKTVTAQMIAFALLARALGPVPFSDSELKALPDAVETVLRDGEPVGPAAETLLDASGLIVVARGFLLGAALETALKIKETCSVLADGYSSADLRHGPIAAVTRGFPVVALNAPGPAWSDIAALVGELRGRGARVLVCASSDSSDTDLPLPGDVPEALVPVLAVVRGQQLAHSLALGLRLDPDAPAGLSKVTVT